MSESARASYQTSMPCLLRDLRERLDQARPAAHRLDREAAPELELAADLERLPAPGRGEAHARLRIHMRGGMALLDEDLGQVGIAAVFGDPRHVVEELLFGVGAEVGSRHLFVRQVDERPQVVDAVVGDAEQPGGEARVAAGFVLGRAFEDQDLSTRLRCGQRRAQRRVAATDDDHIPGCTGAPS